MGELPPWVNIEGVSARYNALMREEFSLVEALEEMVKNGQLDDVDAILDMLIALDKKADEIRLMGGVWI